MRKEANNQINKGIPLFIKDGGRNGQAYMKIGLCQLKTVLFKVST
jgi:hypothetical protein